MRGRLSPYYEISPSKWREEAVLSEESPTADARFIGADKPEPKGKSTLNCNGRKSSAMLKPRGT
jgi:hypothetical protein